MLLLIEISNINRNNITINRKNHSIQSLTIIVINNLTIVCNKNVTY